MWLRLVFSELTVAGGESSELEPVPAHPGERESAARANENASQVVRPSVIMETLPDLAEELASG
jgi:hypothetical protein